MALLTTLKAVIHKYDSRVHFSMLSINFFGSVEVCAEQGAFIPVIFIFLGSVFNFWYAWVHYFCIIRYIPFKFIRIEAPGFNMIPIFKKSND